MEYGTNIVHRYRVPSYPTSLCREGEFEKAHTDFFEAFKNYDESGSPRRTTCLKYLVLANMLMKSGINPFDSQVARSI